MIVLNMNDPVKPWRATGHDGSLDAVHSDEILAQVREIILNMLGDRDALVYLFGSWASGSARSVSDIDVAIDPLQSLPRGFLAELRERFEESTIPYRVEIVDLSDSDPDFRNRVLKEGIRWNA